MCQVLIGEQTKRVYKSTLALGNCDGHFSPFPDNELVNRENSRIIMKGIVSCS